MPTAIQNQTKDRIDTSGGPIQTSLPFSLPLCTVLISYAFSFAKQCRKIGYFLGNALYFLSLKFPSISAIYPYKGRLYIAYVHTVKHLICSVKCCFSPLFVPLWSIYIHFWINFLRYKMKAGLVVLADVDSQKTITVFCCTALFFCLFIVSRINI